MSRVLQCSNHPHHSAPYECLTPGSVRCPMNDFVTLFDTHVIVNCVSLSLSASLSFLMSLSLSLSVSLSRHCPCHKTVTVSVNVTITITITVTITAINTVTVSVSVSVHCRWVDMFDEFPSLSGSIPLAAVLELCPVMHPRHYSIASSSWSKSNQVTSLCLHLAAAAAAAAAATASGRPAVTACPKSNCVQEQHSTASFASTTTVNSSVKQESLEMSDSRCFIASFTCVHIYVMPVHACMRNWLCHKWFLQDSVLQDTCFMAAYSVVL